LFVVGVFFQDIEHGSSTVLQQVNVQSDHQL